MLTNEVWISYHSRFSSKKKEVGRKYATFTSTDEANGSFLQDIHRRHSSLSSNITLLHQPNHIARQPTTQGRRAKVTRG